VVSSCFQNRDGFGKAKRSEPVEHICADLQFSDLSVQFSGHDTVAEQLDAAHFGFDAGSSVVAGPSFP